MGRSIRSKRLRRNKRELAKHYAPRQLAALQKLGKLCIGQSGRQAGGDCISSPLLCALHQQGGRCTPLPTCTTRAELAAVQQVRHLCGGCLEFPSYFGGFGLGRGRSIACSAGLHPAISSNTACYAHNTPRQLACRTRLDPHSCAPLRLLEPLACSSSRLSLLHPRRGALPTLSHILFAPAQIHTARGSTHRAATHQTHVSDFDLIL